MSGGEASTPGPEPASPPELAPLANDGVASVTVGTALWLAARLTMLPFTGDLRGDGHLWWIATAATGFGLGLVGILYCVRRRNRLRASGEQCVRGSGDQKS